MGALGPGRTFAVWLAVSAAGCTLVAPLGDLTGASSSQEQTEGGSEGGSPDAGNDVTPDVGNASDAQGESTTDAPLDSGSDIQAEAMNDTGGPPADALSDMPTTTGFCAGSTHFFCADFDEGNVGAGWSLVQAGGTGDLALDTNAYTSPPASARIGGDQNASGALTKYLSPTVPPHVHVELDMIGCAVPSAGVVTLLNVGQDMSGNTGENVLRVQSDGSTVFIVDAYPGDGAEAYNRYILPSGLSTTSWTHVALDVVLSETSGTVTLSFGGQQVLSVSGIPTASANVVDTFVAIETRTSQVTAAETAWFDDVAVDLPP